jgi:hypothetical protein
LVLLKIKKVSVFRAQLSDLKVMVVEADQFYNHIKSNKNFQMEGFIQSHFKSLGLMDKAISVSPGTDEGEINIDGFENSLIPKEVIIVLSKSDLMVTSDQDLRQLEFKGLRLCLVSCKTGYGFDNFLEVLVQKVKDM